MVNKPTSLPQPRSGALAQSVVKLLLLASSAFPLFGSSPVQETSNNPIVQSPRSTAYFLYGSDHMTTFREVSKGSPQFWWMLSVIVVLVLLGGCFAGLTLGLMGLDILNLRVLSTSGSVTEQAQAKKVLKLLERGRHWVLVVLLLSNVVVNETLPIFLDTVLGGGAAAILISTALIVIFGEIIPQSICVRYGLSIGAKSAPFVLALMYLEFPIAYPIALLLDYMLGHDEGVTYRKAELKTFVGLHRHIGTDGLNEDEVTIISAVLDLSSKTIVDIMTPIEETFTLGEDSILDEATVTELVSQGYSRVPIHQAGHDRNFIGMLLVKHLISYDPEDAKPVRDFQLSTLPEGAPDMTCLEALNFFQQGRSHMLLVSSQPGEQGGALGVVSLEDVIEEMIGEEIIDETDQYVDVAHKIKVIRKPLGNRSSTRGIAPLLKGVIEKRRHEELITRSDGLEGEERDPGNVGGRGVGGVSISNRSSMEGGAGFGLWKSPAFDKVKVKPAASDAITQKVVVETDSTRRRTASKNPPRIDRNLHRSILEEDHDEDHEGHGRNSDTGTEHTPLLDRDSTALPGSRH